MGVKTDGIPLIGSYASRGRLFLQFYSPNRTEGYLIQLLQGCLRFGSDSGSHFLGQTGGRAGPKTHFHLKHIFDFLPQIWVFTIFSCARRLYAFRPDRSDISTAFKDEPGVVALQEALRDSRWKPKLTDTPLMIFMEAQGRGRRKGGEKGGLTLSLS